MKSGERSPSLHRDAGWWTRGPDAGGGTGSDRSPAAVAWAALSCPSDLPALGGALSGEATKQPGFRALGTNARLCRILGCTSRPTTRAQSRGHRRDVASPFEGAVSPAPGNHRHGRGRAPETAFLFMLRPHAPLPSSLFQKRPWGVGVLWDGMSATAGRRGPSRPVSCFSDGLAALPDAAKADTARPTRPSGASRQFLESKENVTPITRGAPWRVGLRGHTGGCED